EQNADLEPVLHALGGQTRAEVLLGEALAIALDGTHVPVELAARAGPALLDAESGRLEEALPHLAHCRAIPAGGEAWRGAAGRGGVAGGGARAEAAGALAQHQPDAAAGGFAEAIAAFRRCEAPWDEAQAHLARGRVLMTAGTPASASEPFAAAAHVLSAIGA